MRRSMILALLACLTLTRWVAAQPGTPGLNVYATVIPAQPLLVSLEVTGHPGSFFDVFYTIDPLTSPVLHLLGGNLGPLGVWRLTFPLQGSVNVQDIWLGAFIQDPISVAATFAGPVRVSLAATPAAPPAGPRKGVIVYRDGMVILRGTFCPGDFVELKINGVTVLSTTAPASGEVTLAAAATLGPGDTFSACVNGAPWP
jgi:hypothetical protein